MNTIHGYEDLLAFSDVLPPPTLTLRGGGFLGCTGRADMITELSPFAQRFFAKDYTMAIFRSQERQFIPHLKGGGLLAVPFKRCEYDARDPFDYWQTPAEFFISHKGDCEDFHSFISYVCLRRFHPYKTWVARTLTSSPYFSRHVYSVIENIPGKFITINYFYIFMPVNSIEETIQWIPGAFSFCDAFEVSLI